MTSFRTGGSGGDIAAQLDDLLASPDFAERLARVARGLWPSRRDVVSAQFNNLVGGGAPGPAAGSETPDTASILSPTPPCSSP